MPSLPLWWERYLLLASVLKLTSCVAGAHFLQNSPGVRWVWLLDPVFRWHWRGKRQWSGETQGGHVPTP